MGKSKSLKSDRAVKKTVKNAESNNEAHLELVNTLYSKFKKLIESKGQSVSAGTIIVIIDSAMKLASQYKNLSGLEKKAIVITVVKRLVEESDLSDEDEEVIKVIVERALDTTIDQLFEMAPQVYGKIKTGCASLFKKK